MTRGSAVRKTPLRVARFVSSLALAGTAAAQQLPAPSVRGYAKIEGASIYYEEYGAGRPIVLLHGGLNTIESSFSRQIGEFSRGHRVIGIEQAGHGHTKDTRDSFRYDQMAEDTAKVILELGLESPDIVGWSDGGTVALVLARRHPSLVGRVVVSGAAVRAEGMGPAALKRLREGSLEELLTALPAAYKAAYSRASPDGPQHWAVVVGKSRELWLTPVVLEDADLAAIAAPTLVVAGDHDFVTLDHTLRIFRALPKAELCILPGTGHATFQTEAEVLDPIILSFLDRPR